MFRLCDAEYVNEAMPDYAGFVFYEKSHRFVDERRAAKLRSKIAQSIHTVGVFVDHDPHYIKTLYENGIISVVQLHGTESEAYIAKLRAMLPGVQIWKAFKVRSEADIAAAQSCDADCILLDNGYGTGQCFDWSLISDVKRPMILAGGLNAENIAEAIDRFHPFAVDISSGVETDKVKDKSKILAAVAAVRGK
ncbi:N-(5'-phosphoribosyl)anthranilate isomerase [bioreactor metagenome]|uniref:phosphoribosylanthranilate isomerase n=1 Tax=bioreactor metagenome TaxID=1076179 RepID=A0A645I9E0_9ZZZZ